MWVARILISCVSLFQHPFVTQPLNRSLAIELLDKMNNPDHSTYHDFDDDDPEVGISFNHRIRLRFNLPGKLTDWDLFSPRIFGELGIVSRLVFTFSCAVLSLIEALSKNHYITGKRRLKKKKKRFEYFKILFIAVLNNFETVNVICFSSPEFCDAFFVKLCLYLQRKHS